MIEYVIIRGFSYSKLINCMNGIERANIIQFCNWLNQFYYYIEDDL